MTLLSREPAPRLAVLPPSALFILCRLVTFRRFDPSMLCGLEPARGIGAFLRQHLRFVRVFSIQAGTCEADVDLLDLAMQARDLALPSVHRVFQRLQGKTAIRRFAPLVCFGL